ncbi:plasmid replication protein RepC [Rhizobium ruizarguesonis]|uniref:plasmid replication protein RepC n=1 Tax=Rhizobium ruizarguesonis TaxID=2081791 RepID=UPI0013DFD76D|nr:plasmid replication protein RepC [Rhizobium ruizarguesonis]MBY5890827.1 replication initiation protein RepC [Rhizobium leguminosarum]NEI81698.1 replication initiation protein RepC [Rhizobium ruizarguesonis]QSZ05685.1 replication initiation protein RepC [Rhizobium ruizarguesonis]
MQTGNVTTPFGRRPVSLALVRRQQAVAEIKAGKSAEKWKVFRDVSAAMALLGIQSNSLAVLDALLSFYPENDLRQDAPLIVFPSNAQLSLRAHGMAGSTLRRHLAALVEAGLIVRKDSANGKRYVRRDHAGDIENAFGFDLSPLLSRAEELAMLAQQIVAERAAFKRMKENLTICRRDVRKLISAAMEEGAAGDWQAIEGIYVGLIARLPRTPSPADISTILEEMQMLKEEVLNRLENQEKTENPGGNAAHTERHIQNSKPESFNELEPSSRKEQGAKSSGADGIQREPLKAFPLGLVLKACPQVIDYGAGGAIGTWRELMSAAIVVRSMLGISPSAYQEACEIMGPENAAVAVAGILERANMINSPGGYLRDLTRRSERGEFSLGPMIMALLKANGLAQTRAG